MWQHTDQLRDTIALAEAQAPLTDLTRLAEWDRTPDPTRFSIGCQRLVAPTCSSTTCRSGSPPPICSPPTSNFTEMSHLAASFYKSTETVLLPFHVLLPSHAP